MSDTETTPAVVALRGSVAYQAESIVSRVLVKREHGSVTLFAFDAGQELSEHTTPYDAILQVVEGEAEVQIASRTHRLEALEVVHMPAGVPHAVRAVTRTTLMLVMVT